jgi:hypothetical protein
MSHFGQRAVGRGGIGGQRGGEWRRLKLGVGRRGEEGRGEVARRRWRERGGRRRGRLKRRPQYAQVKARHDSTMDP